MIILYKVNVYVCNKITLDANFCKTLTVWYLANKRDLPWRDTKDPYVIWLSEIILQQTKVVQGLPYFLTFEKRFPSVDVLAKASEEEVLKLWQGLGYYSRARNLLKAAIMVMNDFEGIFPKSFDDVIKLKGVGVYTASAIASFSNNEKVAVVDGNVYRVLSRIFGIFKPINSSEGIKEFKLLADSLLNKEDPATHNQAIMEFGALQCTPKNTLCDKCPFSERCYAFNNQVVNELPVKLKKIKIRKRYFNFLFCESDDKVLLEQRIGKGIWENMYQLPLIESEKLLDETEVNVLLKAGDWIKEGEDAELIEKLSKPYKLSHQHIYASFYKLNSFSFKDSSIQKVDVAKLKEYPVPVLVAKFLEDYVFNEGAIL